jgi:arylsulfatase A-like enzyme
MARESRFDRRAFLKSAALGATSLTVGACSSKAKSRWTALDAGQAPDGAAAADSGMGLDAGPFVDEGTALDSADDARATRPPNVLFILADQWRAQALGSAGDPNAKTPALDRLVSESVTFSHAVSCTPVCCPYRATLMTARYPTDTGVFINDVNLAQDPNSLASMFKKAGYDTGYIGKWHLDGQGCRMTYTPPERRQGFSRWAALECTHDYNNSVYYAGDNGVDRLTWPGYDAIAQTREMQRWITERDPATPFFYFLSWGPPHDPYGTAPAEFTAQFTPDAIQLRPNVPSNYAAEARTNLAGYYAHMAALDRCVEDLLGTLDTLGIADNTIVVFTSDHGDMHRSQGQLWKEQPWDESILVPFILRYPSALGRAPRTVPMRISTPDIMPTLLGLARQQIPTTIQGRDLSPVLRQEKAPDDQPALVMCVSPFGNWNRSMGGKEFRGLRTSRYTYVRDLAGPWLLYDNIADPYQMNNLVGTSAYSDEQAAFDAQLAAKLASIGDPFREGSFYVDQWGYDVNPDDGSVPTLYGC